MSRQKASFYLFFFLTFGSPPPLDCSYLNEAKGTISGKETLLQHVFTGMMVLLDMLFPSVCYARKPMTRVAAAAVRALRAYARTSWLSQDPQSESRSRGLS